MKASFAQLFIFALCYTAATASSYGRRQSSNSSSNAASTSYLIIDNDWGPTDFTMILLALASNYTLLGLTSDSANTWALQGALQALRSLELGNLTSCIPVYKGADYPLLNNPSLFQSWEYLHGMLPWQGVFAPENDTAEAMGMNPTSGDPSRIVPAAFVGGIAPNQSLLAGYEAAWFMIESVRNNPGQVSIYTAGALTNIALAVRLDSTFARNVKEIVVMGGWIDTNLYQVTGSLLEADINTDINLKIDPEGAKIALTADFPNITLIGTSANSVYMNQSDYQDLMKVNNSFTEAFTKYYFPVLPLWDASGLAAMLYPDTIITNSTEFYVDIDVSWFSPSYGEVKAYQAALTPKGQALRTVTYPFSLDVEGVKNLVKQAMLNPGSCADV